MKGARIVAAALALAFAVFPYVWMLSSAFKPDNELLARHPALLPAHPTLEHFATALGAAGLARAFGNSLAVALLTTLATLIVAAPAAYALARYEFRGRSFYAGLLLAVQFFPLIALVIPLFLLLRAGHLLNSYAGLTLAYLTFTVPLTVWLLQGFFRGVPRSIEDAARIDGLSEAATFFKIALPLAAPGIAAAALYAFISAWDEFMLALVIMQSPDMRTLPVALAGFISDFSVDWGGVMAAATLFSLPAIAIFLFVEKRLTGGVVGGAVKG